MKNPQRHFVIERKLSRKSRTSIPKTIWGDVDLKSIALAVREDTAPGAGLVDGQKFIDGLTSNDLTNQPPLTASSDPWTDTTPTQERSMADELDPTLNADSADPQAAPASEAKKQRKPRVKKIAAETAAADVSAESPTSSTAAVAKRGKQTRARKTNPTLPGTASVKKNTRRPAAKPAQPVTAAGTVTTDDLADLLQLEQENQKLRKLLADKLRGENMDLRKKLGLN